MENSTEIERETSLQDIRMMEERERERRVSGSVDEEEAARDNARLVACLVDNMRNHSARGKNRYSTFLEEKERKRRLKECVSDCASRIQALSIAQIVKDAHVSKTGVASTGAHVQTRLLEEQERERRIADKTEAVSRRMKSITIAKDIFLQGPIIRARLSASAVPDIVEQTRLMITLDALKATYNTLAPAVRFMILVGIGMGMELGNIAAARFPRAASYVPSISPLWDTVQSFVFNVRGTVGSYIPEKEHVDLKKMEEDERFRRILEDPVSKLPEANAKRIARLVKCADIPAKFPRRNGSLKFTNALQEKERVRRMANKDEAHCCRMNAYKTADLICHLLRASNCKFFKVNGEHLQATRALEEEERARRMAATADETFTSRWNARNVARLVHEVLFQSTDNVFFHAYTRNLEEEERARRIKAPFPAVYNAHNVADMFVKSRFFTGEQDGRTCLTTQGLETSQALENEASKAADAAKTEARRFSLLATGERSAPRRGSIKPDEVQMAQECASNIKYIISHDVNLLQENEKEYRMSDKLWQQQAKDNACKVSEIVKAHFNPAVEKIHQDTPTPSRFFNAEQGSVMTDHALLAAPAQAIPPPPSPHPTLTESTPALAIPPNTPIDQEIKESINSTASSGDFQPIFAPVSIHMPTNLEDIFPSSSPRGQSYIPTVNAPNAMEQAKKNNRLRSFTKRLNKESPNSDRRPDVQLLQNVRKQHEHELQLAKKEQDKVEKLKRKLTENKGMFGDYRLQRHQAAAVKHQKAAARHRQWLDENDSVIAHRPSV